ncbi:MAG: hypothetical protein ACREX9_24400 [Gammaproteobacteria bacterium]
MNKSIYIGIGGLILSACAPYPFRGADFENVKLGMSKAEVAQNAGRPTHVIGSRNIDGRTVEVLEYRRGGLWWGDLDESYWLFFNNDKLEKWGRPGDHLRYVE